MAKEWIRGAVMAKERAVERTASGVKGEGAGAGCVRRSVPGGGGGAGAAGRGGFFCSLRSMASKSDLCDRKSASRIEALHL